MLDSSQACMEQGTRAQKSKTGTIWNTGTPERWNAGTLEYIILERQNTRTETRNTKLLNPKKTNKVK